jgi:hypothetical protein
MRSSMLLAAPQRFVLPAADTRPDTSGILFLILSPLAHGVAHRQHLALKGGAILTNRQVQAHRQAVLPAQGTVLSGNEQRRDFFTGSVQ